MELIGEKIGSKMQQGIQQLESNLQMQSTSIDDMGSIFERIFSKIENRQEQGIQQLSQRINLDNSQQSDIGGFFELLIKRIGDKQQEAVQQFANNLQKGAFKIEEKKNNSINYSMQNGGQFFNPAMPNYNDFTNYQNNNNYGNMISNGQINGGRMQDINNQMGLGNLNQNLHNGLAYDFAQESMRNQMAYSLAQQNIYSIQNDEKNIQVYQQNNPQNIYRQQFKTRDGNKIVKHKNKSKDQIQNKFSAYKKQLANLEDMMYDDINYQLNSPQRQNMDHQLANTQKIDQKYHQVKKKKSEKKIYQMEKDQIRKHSFRKEKEAQSQMMANIQFLKSLRGSSNFHNNKKQWKQDTKNIRDTIEQIRQAKKKQLQTLGFSSPSKLLRQSKLGESMVTVGMENGQSSLLPEIKKSRKKALIHKPAPFSVYTIQRDNEIFVNKIPN